MKQSPMQTMAAILAGGVAGFMLRSFAPAGWQKLTALWGRSEAEERVRFELLLQ